MSGKAGQAPLGDEAFCSALLHGICLAGDISNALLVVLLETLWNHREGLERLHSALGRFTPRPPRQARREARRVKQLSAEDRAAAVERYLAGETTRDIARDFGIHHERIGKVLRDAGVRLRRSGMTELEIDEAVLLYEDGWSLAPIGTKLGVNALTVRNRLRERGVRIRSPHERVS